MSEHKLARLRRARAFDRAALAAIYDEYHQAIYRYIYRQVSDVETARDLAAEVFHRFLKAIQKGKGPDRELQVHPQDGAFRACHGSPALSDCKDPLATPINHQFY